MTKTRKLRGLTAAVAAIATAAAGVVLSVAAGVAGAPPAQAAPAAKVVNAWLPWWSITAATNSAVGNADLMNEASPFWFQANDASTVVIKPGATEAGLITAVNALHAAKIKAIPSVTDNMPATYSATMLSDSTQRTQQVNALMGLVSKYNLDGLDMDYETIAFGSNLTIAPQIRAGYSALLSELGARLHAAGKLLTVAVLAKTQEGTSAASQAYDYAAIGAAADRVRLMTYDQHTRNTAYPGGAVASVQWVNAVLQYATSVIPSSKVEMGVPLYGYDYSDAGGPAATVLYGDVVALMNQYHVARQWSATDGSPYITYTASDGSHHTVWYNDAGSLAARLPLVAKYKIAGVSFWSLGGEDPGIWNVLRSYTYGPNPFGAYDSINAAPGGAQVSGWALDPNTTDPIRIDFYSNNVGITSTTANVARPDIASLYVIYGPNHGFSATLKLPVGQNNVCAYAINVGDGGNTLLGCKVVNVMSGSPFGSFDVAAPAGPGKVHIRGWSLDPDTTSPTRLDVYVDGKGAASGPADGTRGDIARLYPVYGAAHGFDQTLTVGGGTHQVCAFAINAAGPGGNTLLGCRTVTLPTGNPHGSFDVAQAAGPGKIHIRGWSIDPDSADPTRLDVYIDGKGASSGPANGSRPDVAAAFPGYGPLHGFDQTLSVTGGRHQVCAFAINIGPGGNTLLGCRTVTLPSGSAVGSIDSVTPGAGSVEVRGWALDPDTADPIRVDMYIDGKGASSGNADLSRPDVASVFAGYGPLHGYDRTMTGLAPGKHQVCVYAINVGPGAPNTNLGCRAFTTS